MRGLLLAACAAVALVGSGARAAEKDPIAELQAIGTTIDAGKCDQKRAKAYPKRKDFAGLNSALKSVAWSFVAMCADGAKDEKAAIEKAIAEPDAIEMAWSLKFNRAVYDEQFAEAVPALEKAVAVKDADDTLSVYDRFVYDAAYGLKSDRAAFGRMMAALHRADWKPRAPNDDASWLWRRYAGHLLDAGQVEQAKAVARRIQDPATIAEMVLLKKFDPVTQDPNLSDPQTAAETFLQRQIAALREAGVNFVGVNSSSQQLRRLGRHEEALKLLDMLLDGSGPIVDSSGEDARHWALDQKAVVLLEMGRGAEAIALMKTAAAMKESGAPNVSQTINLSGLQNEVGDHAGALQTLDAASGRPMSDYGRMWVAAEKVCALYALSRPGEAAKDLAFTASSASKNGPARVKALLCASDTEGAAASLISQLKNDDDQAEALLQLSRFQPPKGRQDFATRIHERMEVVRGRSDVQAAVATVGRTKDFTIQAAGIVDAY